MNLDRAEVNYLRSASKGLKARCKVRAKNMADNFGDFIKKL